MKHANNATNGSLSEPAVEPGAQTSPPAGEAAKADALPTGTERRKMKQQPTSQNHLTAPQLGLLHVVPPSPSIPLSSKENKSSKGVPSSCVNGSPPSLDDVPTPGNEESFDTEDDKMKQVRRATTM